MRILVIEKDARMIRLLEKALKDQSIGVDVSTDPEQALFLSLATDYDVILIDEQLSKIGGIELCYMLREKGVKSPIIVISARGSLGDVIRALDSGADDCLSGSLNLAELLARVRAAARRRRFIIVRISKWLI